MQYICYANQGFPQEQFKKIFKSKITKKTIYDYMEILKKNGINNPNILFELEQKGCTYAYIANAIITKIIMDSSQELTDSVIKEIFGFSLSHDDETLDCNMLMLDMFAFLYDKVKLTVHKYQTYHYKNAVAAAKDLLDKDFASEQEAIIELFNNGIISDGIDEITQENRYKNVKPNNEVILGSYPEIAKSLLNINDENMDKEKLKKLLEEKDITFEEHDNSPESKLSGLIKSNVNAWINYYLLEKNIRIEFTSEPLVINNRTYEEFQEYLKELLNEGYVLEVASSPNSDTFITSNKEKIGVSSKEAGHSMLIVGFDENNDIVVSSWGKDFTIPKQNYKNFQYTKALIKTPITKIIPNKKEI